MKNAFHIVRSAAVDLGDHAFLVIFCSLAWLFLSLLVIPGPPATLALFEVAQRIARHDHMLDVRDYLPAVRKYFGVGWRWGAINLSVLAVLLIDILAVPRMVPDSVALLAQLFFFVAAVVWTTVNWYALAFLFQQKELSVRQALRNGAVLLLQYPLLTLILVVVMGVLLGLGAVLVILIIPLLLFGPMLAALISTHTVLNRLAVFRASQQPPAPPD